MSNPIRVKGPSLMRLTLTVIAAVSCNNKQHLLLLLTTLDIEFDYALLLEINQLLYLGVRLEWILFSACYKDSG